jgi:hypothetical protein
MIEICKLLAGVACRRSGDAFPAAWAAILDACSDEQLNTICASMWQLPGRRLAVAQQVCAALPVSCCCNNPGCANLAGPSEQQLVAGKGCVCERCRSAR